jgi:hypothetical protein
MPTLSQPPPFDPPSVPTHAKGRWFIGSLVGVWPVAIVLAFIGVALGLPEGITFGSCLATALAVDFVIVVMTLAVDDGDIQHRSEDR